MATTRAAGYVVTASVWNSVLASLSDDGATYSGAFNGGSVIGTTGSFSSTLSVTGDTTLLSRVGIGAAPSSSIGTGNIQISGGVLSSANPVSYTGNLYYDSVTDIRWEYFGNGYGVCIQENGSGGINFLTAPNNASGAGAAATLTSRFTIGNTGAVTVPGTLAVTGTTAFAGAVSNTSYYNSATVQPGFLAYNSAGDTSVTTLSTVDFDTEVYDDGGNFATDTFTAPVTGRYLFAACVAVTNNSGGAGTVGIVLKVSNHTNGLRLASLDLANTDDGTLSGMAIVDMDAADTAYIQIQGITVDVGGGSSIVTHFSGRLLP